MSILFYEIGVINLEFNVFSMQSLSEFWENQGYWSGSKILILHSCIIAESQAGNNKNFTVILITVFVRTSGYLLFFSSFRDFYSEFYQNNQKFKLIECVQATSLFGLQPFLAHLFAGSDSFYLL